MSCVEAFDLPQAIISAFSEGVLAYKASGECVLANEAAAAIIGTDVGRLLGQNFREIESWRRSDLLRMAEEALETGGVRHGETRLVTTFGKEIWLDCYFSPFVRGGEPHLLFLINDVTERRVAERALRESEERFRTIYEGSNDALMLATEQGFFDCNSRTLEMFGFSSREEFARAHRADLSPPTQPDGQASLPAALARIETAYREGSNRFEWMHRRSDGECFPAEVLLTALELGGKRVLYATVRDITARKQAEELLQFQNAVLATQQETSLDGILVVGYDGRVVSYNQRFFAIMGVDPEIARSGEDEPLLQAVTGKMADPEGFLRRVRYLYEHPEEKSREEILLADGRVIDRYSATMFGPDGRNYGRVWYFQDITERRQAEAQLRQAHGEVEQLLASMSSFLIGLDANGRITRWNVAAETTFGLSASSVIGKRFEECNLPRDVASIPTSVPGWPRVEQVVRLPEMRYTRDNGADGYLGITVNPIRRASSRDESGALEGSFLLGVDITERRNLEMRLVQAQKLELIGQLAAGIAHEINTPTQYIGDNLEFLREAFGSLGQLTDKYGELMKAARGGAVPAPLVQEIESAAPDMDLEYLTVQIPKAIGQSLDGVSRVAKIVQAMKEFSHPGTGEKSSVDINQAIESTITVARNEWKYVAEVVTDLDPSLPLVLCLPGELNQVILNILVNAAHAIRDAVPEGSRAKGTITVSTRRDGDWAEIRIRDTGTGIAEDARDRIFDPFFTTKEVGRGTGQGLAIARNAIVNKHGGTLTFETEIGEGSVFIVRLPIQES